MCCFHLLCICLLCSLFPSLSFTAFVGFQNPHVPGLGTMTWASASALQGTGNSRWTGSRQGILVGQRKGSSCVKSQWDGWACGVCTWTYLLDKDGDITGKLLQLGKAAHVKNWQREIITASPLGLFIRYWWHGQSIKCVIRDITKFLVRLCNLNLTLIVYNKLS